MRLAFSPRATNRSLAAFGSWRMYLMSNTARIIGATGWRARNRGVDWTLVHFHFASAEAAAKEIELHVGMIGQQTHGHGAVGDAFGNH